MQKLLTPSICPLDEKIPSKKASTPEEKKLQELNLKRKNLLLEELILSFKHQPALLHKKQCRKLLTAVH